MSHPFDEEYVFHWTESQFTVGKGRTDFQLNGSARIFDQIDNIRVKHVRQINVVHGEYAVVDMQLATEIGRTVRNDLS